MNAGCCTVWKLKKASMEPVELEGRVTWIHYNEGRNRTWYDMAELSLQNNQPTWGWGWVPGKPELTLALRRHLQTELVPLTKWTATKEHFSLKVLTSQKIPQRRKSPFSSLPISMRAAFLQTEKLKFSVILFPIYLEVLFTQRDFPTSLN